MNILGPPPSYASRGPSEFQLQTLLHKKDTPPTHVQCAMVSVAWGTRTMGVSSTRNQIFSGCKCIWCLEVMILPILLNVFSTFYPPFLGGTLVWQTQWNITEGNKSTR